MKGYFASVQVYHLYCYLWGVNKREEEEKIWLSFCSGIFKTIVASSLFLFRRSCATHIQYNNGGEAPPYLLNTGLYHREALCHLSGFVGAGALVSHCIQNYTENLILCPSWNF